MKTNEIPIVSSNKKSPTVNEDATNGITCSWRLLMVFKPKTNIYEMVLPFFFFLKLLGYGYFRVKGNITDGQIRTTFVEILLFIFFFSYNLFLLYLSLTTSYSIAKSPILDFGGKIVLWTSLFMAGVSEAITFRLRKVTWGILRKYYNFDNMVRIS